MKTQRVSRFFGILIVAAVVAGLGGDPRPARAAQWDSTCSLCSVGPRWPTTPTFRAHTSLGSASSCVLYHASDAPRNGAEDLFCVAGEYSSVPRSWLSVAADDGLSSSTISGTDGVNGVYYVNYDFCGGTDTIACTVKEYDCGCGGFGPELLDADIVVHANAVNWVFGEVDSHFETRNSYETTWTFRQVLMHEMGHAVGLAHDTKLAVMHPQVPNGGRFYGGSNGLISLYADDRTGLAGNGSQSGLYQYTGGTHYDVAVTPWENSQEYGRTLIYHVNGGDTTLCPGESGTVRRAYMNLSTVTAYNVFDHFYLSTNNYISFVDIDAGSASTISSMGRNTSFPRNSVFTVPSNTPSDDYWVGSIMDSDFTSDDESDNDKAIVGKTQITVLSGSHWSCQ